MVTMLAYSDDITVLLVESANELQTLLHVVWKWCQEWDMSINKDHTRIVHFRNPPISKAIEVHSVAL